MTIHPRNSRSPEGEQKLPKPFQSWRDRLITPAVQLSIFSSAAIATGSIGRHTHLGIGDWLLVFWLFQTIFTLILLKLLGAFLPLREGTYTGSEDALDIYIWKLNAFLCVMNLNVLMLNSLLPPIFRQGFYQLLGAKIGPGLVSVGGRIMEPCLVTIGSNAIIGDDATLLPHALSTGDSEVLILEAIRIEAGAIVGAKSLVMPGVTIGENSMIKAMSLVTRGTKVPAGEIWGGVPAKKLGVVQPQTGVAKIPNPLRVDAEIPGSI